MKLTQKDMELVKHHMKVLDIPEAEAIQLVMDDKAVDKGEKLFELSAEQKKVAKKYAGTGTKKRTVYKFDTAKKKKENPVKQKIIAEIERFLNENSEICAEMVQITNAERQIAFKIGENDYELTLVQKRKAKK
nr:MAG TPA: hypothetical protein [Caudoviricetes sp.]